MQQALPAARSFVLRTDCRKGLHGYLRKIMLTYFVRHAESQGNTGRSNEPDCSLSDFGRLQAQRLADRLAQAGVRAIYSSPMRRSVETAMPLAERLDLDIWLRPDIAEHFSAGIANLEHFTPCSLADLAGAWPRLRLDPALPADTWQWPVWPESVETLAARMRRFVMHLKATWLNPDDAVAVFSHGAPVARGLEAWIIETPGPEYRFSIENATVNLARFGAGVSTLLLLNESSHLAGLATQSREQIGSA